MNSSIPRLSGSLVFIAVAVIFLVAGLSTLRQGMLEFRLRFAAQDVFADTQALDADVKSAFIVATADKYPSNSNLQATAYQTAIVLDALRGGDVPQAEAIALVERGKNRLRQAPANPFLWVNLANVTALAFEEADQDDPALEALMRSFERGFYEFQLFSSRSLFCVSYVKPDAGQYADSCKRQLALFAERMPKAYQRFEVVYGVDGIGF